MNAPIGNNKSEPATRQSLWNYVLIVVTSAAMGAGLTWLFTARSSHPEVHPTLSGASVERGSATPDVSGLSAGDAAVVLGNFAYDHQNWSEAIRQYEQAITSGIDTPDVHTDLGNALRFSGRPQKALAQYQVAQKLNPQHENSLFNQISLFTEVLHEPTRAIPLCEEFIRRFPASEKLSVVQQQLARSKNAPESNQPFDIQSRVKPSDWLKQQQDRKP
jgi:tetratricopeptide (TPR) repeat protein